MYVATRLFFNSYVMKGCSSSDCTVYSITSIKPQGLTDFWLLLLKTVGPAEGEGGVGVGVDVSI